MDISGKVVIITGAAGGLGHIVATHFAEAGAELALFDNHEGRLREQCGALAEKHGATLHGGVNVLEAEVVAAAVADVAEQHGRIDALLNIAGGYRAGNPLHETPLDTYDFMLNLNAKSVYLVSKAVIPYMLPNTYGKIVNVASLSALEARKGDAAYAASKAAVLRMTESMAKELSPHRINVNAIIPRVIDTEANRKAMPTANYDKWVKPEQIAEVLHFLVSDTSSAITGVAVPLHGYAW